MNGPEQPQGDGGNISQIAVYVAMAVGGFLVAITPFLRYAAKILFKPEVEKPSDETDESDHPNHDDRGRFPSSRNPRYGRRDPEREEG